MREPRFTEALTEAESAAIAVGLTQLMIECFVAHQTRESPEALEKAVMIYDLMTEIGKRFDFRWSPETIAGMDQVKAAIAANERG